MTAHLKRWITTIVIVPALFTAIIYGPAILFAVIVAVLVMGGIAEYNTMVFERGAHWEKGSGLLLGLLIIVAAFAGDSHVMSAMTTFSVMIAFLMFLYNARNGAVDLSLVAKVVFGLIYIPFMLSHIILIRQWEFGVQWVFFIIFLAFSGDVSAYYVGKSMGKKKLMPAVSAGKTVEGTVGLVIGSIVGCLIYSVIFFRELSLVHVVWMAFVGSILGQLGDLCESTIKRFFAVKDSGFLFPGHGGVLDRLDSLIFIIPFVYYYRVLVIQ